MLPSSSVAVGLMPVTCSAHTWSCEQFHCFADVAEKEPVPCRSYYKVRLNLLLSSNLKRQKTMSRHSVVIERPQNFV